MYSAYNQRVDECRNAIALINQKTNKEYNLNSIDVDAIELIKENKVLYKRLLHLITENKRVFNYFRGEFNYIFIYF